MYIYIDIVIDIDIDIDIYIYIYIYVIRNELLEAQMFAIDLMLQTFRR